MLRGFLAGMQTVSISDDGDAFDEAYDLLGHVDEKLLDAYAEDLRNDAHLHIVFGSRLVSVFDRVEQRAGSANNNSREETTNAAHQQPHHEDSVVTRHMIFNERSGFIQTAVPVDAVGAPYDATKAPPPPLASTHLGGLALAYLIWRKSLLRAEDRYCQEAGKGYLQANTEQQPNVVLIGAGGCSLATTLASVTKSLTAVEVCSEVIQAAEQWFGVGPRQRQFDLIQSCGIEYVASQAQDASIDVLLIDAEDGAAPPREMQTSHFWSDIVLPKLARSAVVGINVIGDRVKERDVFQHRLEQYLNNKNKEKKRVVVHNIVPPPEAALTGDTCALFFFRVSTATAEDTGVPTTASILDDIGRGGGTKDDYALLSRVVSEPEAWKRALLRRDDEKQRSKTQL